MKQALSTLILAAVLPFSAWSQDNTTVNWSNFSFSSTTQNAVLFRDFSGVALSQGVAATNTDGFLVQLGYYSAATAANNFAGTWIPVSGFGATNHTSIGDSATLTGSGNGIIDFNSIYGGLLLNTPSSRVYTTIDVGTYVTNSSVTITTSTPPANQIMSIRFYDTAAGTSGRYNAISADDWLWQVPTTTGGGGICNFLIADAFDDGVGGALGDLEFQDAGNAFRTSILIPEPSTYALIGFGALGLFVAYRRRRAISAA